MTRITILLLILAAFCCQLNLLAADAGKLEEIREYFELRETISLVNLEMKRALAPDSTSQMLSDNQAQKNLSALLKFIESRIIHFAESNTALKYHYIKKLDSLYAETRQLFAAVAVKFRVNNLALRPESLINRTEPVVASPTNYTLQPRPYFHPIDVRPLLSPSLIKTGGPVVRDPAEAVAPIKKPAPIPVKSPAALPVKMPEKLVESSSHGIKVIAPPGEKITPATVVTVAAPPEIITPAPAVQLPKPVEKPEPVTQMKPVEPAKPVNPPRPMEHSKTTEAVKSANVTTGIASTVVKLPELPKQPETGKSAEPVKSVASAPSEVIKPVEPAKPLEQVKPVAPIKQVETVKKPEPVVPAGPGAMRPLAIMIENHNQSRPQSGLDQADLVYEMPVEGGITRFMAVYTRLPGLIGPVRSCREYFVDRALEVDALYVHCGGSPLGYAYISKSKINSVDEIKHSKPFFRDKTRKAPHNLYAKGGNIYDYMSETISMRLASQPVLLHYGNAAAVSVEPGNSVKIKYHGNYTLEFKLENGAYQRYMNNDLHVDRETGLPLRASAVVVQVASMKTVDKVGRQEISFIGSGTAWILQNGVMTPVKWHKSSPQAFTSYKDAAGNEYVFPKGLPVWVQVVSPLHKLVFNGVENNIGVAEKGENKTATSSVETGKQG